MYNDVFLRGWFCNVMVLGWQVVMLFYKIELLLRWGDDQFVGVTPAHGRAGLARVQEVGCRHMANYTMLYVCCTQTRPFANGSRGF